MLLILRQVWQPGCRGRGGRLAAKRATRVPGRRPGPGSDYAAASHFLAKTNVWGLPQMLELVTNCPNVKMVSWSSEVQRKQENGRVTIWVCTCKCLVAGRIQHQCLSSAMTGMWSTSFTGSGEDSAPVFKQRHDG